jgi:DNA-binding transcriptional MocR family regulator
MCEVLLNALGPRPDRQVDGVFIAGQLALAITSGALPIGTKMSQQSIADHYGISRMPVREALRCIQAKGLINYVPNHTPVVVAGTASDESELSRSQAHVAALQKQLAEALRLMGKALPYLTDTPDLVQNGADDLAHCFVEFRNANQAGQGGDQ